MDFDIDIVFLTTNIVLDQAHYGSMDQDVSLVFMYKADYINNNKYNNLVNAAKSTSTNN